VGFGWYKKGGLFSPHFTTIYHSKFSTIEISEILLVGMIFDDRCGFLKIRHQRKNHNFIGCVERQKRFSVEHKK
jgi:hypothetical protein